MATINFFGGRVVLGTEFSGYKIGIFEAGTTTAKTTYKESALTTANVHPVVLDANGAAQIWFSGNAKAILYTAADAVVYTDDNVNLESSSSATGADNLILNGSFENDADADAVPDNWTKTLYTGGAFTLDTTTQMHGSKSAKFTSTGTGGGYLTSTATYAIKPSAIYTVGFSLKASVADVRNVAEILWYKADGTASATASTTIMDDSTTNPTSWTEKWYEATAPSDAYFAKYRLTGCHSSDATSGSTWFDDAIFTDGFKKRASNTVAGTLTMSGKSVIQANASIAAHATTMDPWSLGNYVTATGAAVTFTGMAAAPQAGAEVEIYMNAAHVFTDGAVFEVDGDANWTAEIGDRVLIRAKSTILFTVHPRKKTGQSVIAGPQIQTAVATTSGSSVTLSTTVPAWVKKVSVIPSGVSTNGANEVGIQLGTGAGPTWKTSGYVSSGAISTGTGTGNSSKTDGFHFGAGVAPANARYGIMTLMLRDASANEWACSAIIGTEVAATTFAGGAATLSAVLTSIRVIVTTDTFDAGSIALVFE